MSGSSSMSNTERAKRLKEKYKENFPLGTPIVVACEKGHEEDVEAMILGARAAGMDVTAMVSEVGTNSFGRSHTPLTVAATYEHSTIIEILLQYNADTSTTNYGSNALHYAAYNKTNTTTVQLLLNNMKLEDINLKNAYVGNTPLDNCYEYNNSPIKQQLINLIRQKGGKRASELSSDLNNNNVGSSGSGSSSSRPSKRKKVSSSREQPVKITTEQDKCPICQDYILSNNCTWKNNGELVDDENRKIIITKCCNTAYHEQCYVQMLKYRNICAICNRTLIGYRNPIKTLAIKLYNLKF